MSDIEEKRRRRKEYMKKWSHDNREYLREYARTHKRDPIHRNSILKIWREKNRIRIRQKSKQYQDKLRELVIKNYGSKCACCEEKEKVFLCLDHVNNDGNIERRENKSSRGPYLRAKRESYPSSYQILCANCNMAKKIMGICPHQKLENNNK